MTSDLVFERLVACAAGNLARCERLAADQGLARLAAAAGLTVERLRQAENGIEPLSESEEHARKAALRRLIDEVSLKKLFGTRVGARGSRATRGPRRGHDRGRP